MREPDVVRTWVVVCGACWRLELDVERFIADAGMGIAETLLLTAPRACIIFISMRPNSPVWRALRLTSRGRRTENMLASCDMVAAGSGVFCVRKWPQSTESTRMRRQGSPPKASVQKASKVRCVVIVYSTKQLRDNAKTTLSSADARVRKLEADVPRHKPATSR